MLTASPITITRDAPRCAEQVTRVDLRAVEGLIGNFISALAAPPHLQAASLNLARALAEVRLIEWGGRLPTPVTDAQPGSDAWLKQSPHFHPGDVA